MESQRKLYLFEGQTYILVPESSWLSEIKAHPTGVTALKSIEDSLLFKSFVKVREQRDPQSHAIQTEWFNESDGNKLTVVVNADGQLSVNGTPIGFTSIPGTFEKLTKMIQKSGRWLTTMKEVVNEQGQKTKVPRKFYVPEEKLKKQQVTFEPGMNARAPESLFTGVKKGNETPNITAMSQLIGKYEMPVEKSDEKSKEDILRQCNLMLEQAAIEENEDTKKRICEEVEKQLQKVESELPPRGTGQQNGNAGPRRNGNPRTDEERQARHQRLT